MIGTILAYIIAVIIIAYVSNIYGYGQGLYQYYSLIRIKTPEAKRLLKEINETMEKRDVK